MLFHVGADRRAQRGADPLPGGGPDETAALGLGPAGGVAAGPGSGDGLVEFVDGLEHRGDVGDPEPVDADVADVRRVVQADVAGVAACRARPQILLGGQPFLQPLADRGRADGGVVAAADRLADPAGVGQLPGLPDSLGDSVGDPDGGLGVTGGGDSEQLAGLAQFLLGAGLGIESAAAQRGAAGTAGARREFELVVPAAVPGTPGSVTAAQFRALLTQARAVLAAAAALLVGVSRSHGGPPWSLGHCRGTASEVQAGSSWDRCCCFRGVRALRLAARAGVPGALESAGPVHPRSAGGGPSSLAARAGCGPRQPAGWPVSLPRCRNDGVRAGSSPAPSLLLPLCRGGAGEPGAGVAVLAVRAAGTRDGQSEEGEQPGGGDQPGFPGPDERAGELPGAGEFVGLGAAQPQGPPGGDQVGDRRAGRRSR